MTKKSPARNGDCKLTSNANETLQVVDKNVTSCSPCLTMMVAASQRDFS